MPLLIVLTSLHTLWVMGGAQPEALRVWIGNLAFLPIYALAALLTASAARSHQGKLRRAWRFITVALLAWGLGQVAYTYLDVTERTVPFPSVADVGFLLFVPLFLTGVLHFVSVPASRTYVAVFMLDVLIIMLTVAGLVLPWAEQGPLALKPSLATLAHPFSDLLLLVTLLVFTLRQPNSGRAQPALLALGVLAFSAAHVGYGYLSAERTYHVGQVIDPLWNWGAVMFALAACRSTLPPGMNTARQKRWSRLAPRTLQLLPYAAITLSFVGMFQPSAEGSWAPLFSMAVAALVLVRLLIAEFQNGRLTRQLHTQAYTDSLTGLPNRAALYEALPAIVARAVARREDVAVLFIDLDRFKPVNDLFGHAAGDDLLRQAAGRLRQAVARDSLLARMGGDEMVIVCGPCSREAAGVLASDLLKRLAAPFECAGQQLSLSASIGIACIPRDATDAESAVGRADLAMYQAKQAGRNAYRFFESSWHDETSRQFEMNAQLQGALERREFELHYQPIVDLRTGALSSFEALLRWHSPALGSVSPAVFIPAAEQSGLITPIGEWVLGEALRQIKAWRTEGHTHVRVSVNVSALQFAQAQFVETVALALCAHGLPGEALGLELTESTLIHDLEANNAKLAALRALGVRIALDDFGTGFSSLSYLQRLEVNTLKIDRSFVWAMDHKGGPLVKAIVQLAHELELRVVAEGVETAGQLAGVTGFGCDSVQGYFLAKPLGAGDALTYLRNAATVQTQGESTAGTSPSGLVPAAQTLDRVG